MSTVYLTTLEGPRNPSAVAVNRLEAAGGQSEYILTLQGECVCHETLSGGIEETLYVDAVELHGLNLKKMFKIKPARFKFKLKPNFGKMFKIKPGRFKIKARLNLGSVGKKIGAQFDKLFNTRGVSRFLKRNFDLGKAATRFVAPVRQIAETGLDLVTGVVDRLIPGAGGALNEVGQEALNQGEQYIQDEAENVQAQAEAALSDAMSSVDSLMQQVMEPADGSQVSPPLMPQVLPPLVPAAPQPQPEQVVKPQLRPRSFGVDTQTMMIIGGGAVAIMLLMGRGKKRSRRRAA